MSRYSYAASFAVLLSARPILGVGRVWADGKLLRGSAGDLKAAGARRVHLGGEDQALDPLIASAEGAEAPAHRGCAYVVFEGLALADFGNRIPSLTFEVVADVGAVTVGGIARALASEMVGDADLALDGYAAEGDVGAIVAGLSAAAGSWVAADGGAMRLGGADAVAIADEGASRGRTIAAASEVARVVSVQHFDPLRDWQAGSQRAARAGAGRREQRMALPAAIPAAGAKAIAATLLARAEAERVRRTVTLGLAGWALRPGQVVTVAGEDGRWRIERVAIEAMAATATLVPLAPPTLMVTAASGRAVAAADLVTGTTILHAAELPTEDGVPLAQPRLTVAAAGTGAGWRAAALLLRLDDGASWDAIGATAAPATLGHVVVRPGPESEGEAEVVLAEAGMTLVDADAGALDRGANIGLMGDELIQFGRAMPLGAGRWRLGAMRRGLRGTGSAGAVVGDRFVVLAPGDVRAIDLPVSAIGTTVRVMASGVGDGVDPPQVAVAVTGTSVMPPTPTDLRVTIVEGAAVLSWAAGGRGSTAFEARYRVTIDVEGEAWEAVTDRPSMTVTSVARADRALRVAVRQQGALLDSRPATIMVPGGG